MPIEPSTYLGKPKIPGDRLAVRARLPDVYADFVRSLGLSETEIRAMVDEVNRGVKQPACC